VPRQRRPSQYQPWGPKLLQLQNLGGCFVVFFLRGPKSQLWESYGAKTAIKPKKKKRRNVINDEKSLESLTFTFLLLWDKLSYLFNIMY